MPFCLIPSSQFRSALSACRTLRTVALCLVFWHIFPGKPLLFGFNNGVLDLQRMSVLVSEFGEKRLSPRDLAFFHRLWRSASVAVHCGPVARSDEWILSLWIECILRTKRRTLRTGNRTLRTKRRTLRTPYIADRGAHLGFKGGENPLKLFKTRLKLNKTHLAVDKVRAAVLLERLPLFLFERKWKSSKLNTGERGRCPLFTPPHSPCGRRSGHNVASLVWR